MNATATGVPQVACQLRAAAAGTTADTAATELIISHGHFLHRGAFRRTITADTSICTGQPLATIDWAAALHALDAGCCMSLRAPDDDPDVPPFGRRNRAVLMAAAEGGCHLRAG